MMELFGGVCDAKLLPYYIKGKFGLIWEGNEITSSSSYSKYVTPHKMSLYIVANKPVITWKYSAVAEFILNNKIGVVIESLETLESCLKSISADEFQLMVDNEKRMSKLLQEGYFTKLCLQMLDE
ncbi:MAG: hypothetical protein R3Y24_06965 [Eubacteriales bacterium]